jgi:hypothetical protein
MEKWSEPRKRMLRSEGDITSVVRKSDGRFVEESREIVKPGC